MTRAPLARLTLMPERKVMINMTRAPRSVNIIILVIVIIIFPETCAIIYIQSSVNKHAYVMRKREKNKETNTMQEIEIAGLNR